MESISFVFLKPDSLRDQLKFPIIRHLQKFGFSIEGYRSCQLNNEEISSIYFRFGGELRAILCERYGFKDAGLLKVASRLPGSIERELARIKGKSVDCDRSTLRGNFALFPEGITKKEIIDIIVGDSFVRKKYAHYLRLNNRIHTPDDEIETKILADIYASK